MRLVILATSLVAALLATAIANSVKVFARSEPSFVTVLGACIAA